MTDVVRLDFYTAGKPTTAPNLIGSLTEAQLEEFEIRDAYREKGAARVIVDRRNIDAAMVVAGTVVQVTYPAIDADPVFAFLVEPGIVDLLAANDDQSLEFGGPQVIGLLAGATLPIFPADPDDVRGSATLEDKWWWKNVEYGGIAVRMLEEGRDVLATGAPLGHVTWDFNRDEDSDGTPWAVVSGEYQAWIGTNVEEALHGLRDAGDFIMVMSPDLVVSAHQAYGVNRASSTYAAGKVRLTADNILTSVPKTMIWPWTHVTVESKAGTYLTRVSPDYVGGTLARYGHVEATETDDPLLMQKIGDYTLKHQRTGLETLEFEVTIGDDELAGLYTPYVHYRPGDRCTVHSGSAGHDLNNKGVRLTAMRIMLDVATDGTTPDTSRRSLRVVLEINGTPVGSTSTSRQSSASGGGVSVGHKHGPVRELCPSTTACVDLVEGQLTAGTLANGDAENVGGGQWSGGGYQTAYKRAGARSFGTVDVVDSTVVYTFAPGQVFTAGTRYVIDTWSSRHDSASAEIKFGVDSVDEEVVSSLPAYLGPIETGADGKGWGKIRLCWTPSEDRTGVRISWHEVAATGHADTRLVFDDFALFTAPSELAGTSVEAARCDHNHLHNLLAGRDVAAAHPASSVSVLDDAGNYVGDDVEAVLAELAGGGVTDHGALTGLLNDHHTQYQKESEKGAASGYASLDTSTRVPFAQLPTGIAADEVAIGSHGHAEGGDGTHQLLMVKDGVIPLEPVEYDQGPGASVWVYSDQSYGGSGAGEHNHDHGTLTGLADDDHSGYSDSGHNHDHGALTGLGDLDHDAYLAGETGKTYRTIAGVLEPTGAGSWRLVPTNHEDINVDSVTVNVIDANTIEINFGVTALSVVSSHVSADNTLVDNGYTVGCFTTLSHLGIRIYDSAHAIADPTAVQIAASNIWFLSIVRMS